MTWICPACGSDNDTNVLRCTCGVEDRSSLANSQTWAEIEGEKALAATVAGAKLYQVVLPLSTTRGGVIPMMTAYTNSKTFDHASILETIEENGWHLDHVNYVYRMTEIESRDKFLASGQQEAISGEVIGIYLFRAKADKKMN